MWFISSYFGNPSASVLEYHHDIVWICRTWQYRVIGVHDANLEKTQLLHLTYALQLPVLRVEEVFIKPRSWQGKMCNRLSCDNRFAVMLYGHSQIAGLLTRQNYPIVESNGRQSARIAFQLLISPMTDGPVTGGENLSVRSQKCAGNGGLCWIHLICSWNWQKRVKDIPLSFKALKFSTRTRYALHVHVHDYTCWNIQSYICYKCFWEVYM